MSLQSDLKHEQEVAGLKGKYQANMKEGWQHKVRGSEAWKKRQQVEANTEEVKLETSQIKHEIALEKKAIAQTDLSYTRSMGILKGEGQQLQLQLKEFKVKGKTSIGDSFKAEAAKTTTVKKSKTAAAV